MNDRPTPITDALTEKYSGTDPAKARDAVTDSHRDLERQLAAKTEECEGWEKQWREAAMNALTDKTRDELAEARAVIRKMELAIQHHEKLADNALSDWREADSRTVRALHERNDAREQRDRLAEALEKTAKDFILFRDVARENGIVGTLGLESLYLAESALASLNQTTQ